MTEEEKKVEEKEEFEPEIIVEKMPILYRAFFKTRSADLRELFDEYWSKHGEVIARNVGYKGKKKKGGKLNLKDAQKSIEKHYKLVNIYSGVISDLITSYVESEEDKKLMMITEMYVNDFDKEICSIICFLYFWPRLVLNKDLDFNLDNPYSTDFETEFSKRVDFLKHEHRIKKSLDTGSLLTSDNEVTIDVIATIDGEPYDFGTMRDISVVLENFRNAVLKEAILRHKVGDLFEISYENERPDDKKGKTIDAVVKIKNGYELEFLDVEDDELFEVAGYESREAFRKEFKEQHDVYEKNVKENFAFERIIQQIIVNGNIETIPREWARQNVKLFIDRHIKEHKGDKKKAMQAVGASSEGEMVKSFEDQVYKETINQMAIFAYADLFKIERTVEKVLESIMKNVIWTEKESE